MAVDQSKLKALGRRRGLGTPPTDGSPGIDEEVAPSVLATDESEKPLVPEVLRERKEEQGGAPPAPAATDPVSSPAPAPAPAPAPDRAPAALSMVKSEAEGARASPGKPNRVPDNNEDEQAPAPPRGGGRGRGGESAGATSRRVPRPAEEARVPFTTRIGVSTKERLEDAAYSLRMKHQDLINDAIIAHLRKLGF